MATVNAFDGALGWLVVAKEAAIVDNEPIGASVQNKIHAVSVSNKDFRTALEGRATRSSFVRSKGRSGCRR